jgi:hypothetical protein
MEAVSEIQKKTGQGGLLTRETKSRHFRHIGRQFGKAIAGIFSRSSSGNSDKSESSSKPDSTFRKFLPIAAGVLVVLIYTVYSGNEGQKNEDPSVTKLETVDVSNQYSAENNSELPKDIVDISEASPVSEQAQSPVEKTPAPVETVAESSEGEEKALPTSSEKKPRGAVGATSSIAIVASSEVTVRIKEDDKPRQSRNLGAGDRVDIEFTDLVELLITDASRVTLTYNGNELGSLGSPGRVRRISFANYPSTANATAL